MIVIAVALLPDWRCSLWIGLSVSSIIAGVFGLSSLLANVTLDSSSLAIVIGCVGLSVDFSAHVAHSYLHSRGGGDAGASTVEETLQKIAVPIVQGAFSTILAVLPLVFIDAYVFRTCFACVSLVAGLGAVHGLVFLPVVLATFAPPPKATILPIISNNVQRNNGTVTKDSPRHSTSTVGSFGLEMREQIVTQQTSSVDLKTHGDQTCAEKSSKTLSPCQEEIDDVIMTTKL
jgi:multidrug efflux pump subunit AcrB